MKSFAVLGFRNLSRRKSRSLLTLTGIVLAIGFTVGLLSVSEGFLHSIDEMMKSSGPDMFVLPKNVSKMPFGFQGTATLEERTGEQLLWTQGVMLVEPVYMVFSAEGGGAGFGQAMTMVAGVPEKDFFKMRPAAKIAKGRFFKDGDGMVVVLGGVVAENVKKDIGEELELITGQKLKIIGVLTKANEPYDFFAYGPIKPLQGIFNDQGHVSSFMVKAADKEKVDELAADLKEKFPELDVQTIGEMVNQAKKMLGVARAIHFGISCFALIIGVLFVACTMIMSVSERVRELATLRVIGASKGFIVRLIISESVLLSALGGVAGCFFGFGLSFLINFIVFKFFGETFFSAYVSARIVTVGLAIALLIGAFAGLFPAFMILKKNLSESIRYE